jgi:deoxyribose-phosphate aldolase
MALERKSMTVREIARMIDHSLLHPAFTDEEIIKGCEIARKH